MSPFSRCLSVEMERSEQLVFGILHLLCGLVVRHAGSRCTKALECETFAQVLGRFWERAESFIGCLPVFVGSVSFSL